MGQVMSVWMGPGGHSVCYYLRGGEMFNFVGCVETDDVSEEPWTAKFPSKKLQSDFVRWQDDIQIVIKPSMRACPAAGCRVYGCSAGIVGD